MTLTATRELRELTDTQLSELWRAGEIGLDLLTAESDRRDRADRARARASAERAAWLDAAHAQYLAADAECAGRLLARGADIADALSLWRGSEAWARGQASEELCNFWDVHGRLSLAEYRRQQAMQRRAARDERDLDRMRAPAPEVAPEVRPREVRREVRRPMPAPAPAPAPEVRRAPGPIARYMTALDQLTARMQRIDQLTARIAARGLPGGNHA